jgi:hypothetical protein
LVNCLFLHMWQQRSLIPAQCCVDLLISRSLLALAEERVVCRPHPVTSLFSWSFTTGIYPFYVRFSSLFKHKTLVHHVRSQARPKFHPETRD